MKPVYEVRTGANFIRFSPNGEWLAACANGSWDLGQKCVLSTHNAQTGQKLHSQKNCYTTATFTADSQQVLAVELKKSRWIGTREYAFVRWDVHSGTESRRQAFEIEVKDDGAPADWLEDGLAMDNSIVYPQFGRYAYFIGFQFRDVFVLDPESGGIKGRFLPPNYKAFKKLEQGQHPWERAAVAISPDGKLGAWGDDGCFHLCNFSMGGQWVAFPKLHKGWVNVAAISPTGEHVVTGAKDGARVWDVHTQKPIGDLIGGATGMLGKLASHCPTCVVFSPGGNHALINHRLLDVRTQSCEIELPVKGSIESAAFSNDGRFLATAEGTAGFKVWSLPTPDPSLKRSTSRSDSARRSPNPVRKINRIGEMFCPKCGEQNAALDANGYRCGSCGAEGDVAAVAELAAKFNFRTGARTS